MNNSYCISLLRSSCHEMHAVSEKREEDIVENLLSQDVHINYRTFSKSNLDLGHSIKSGHRITTVCAENVNRKSPDYGNVFCVVFGE